MNIPTHAVDVVCYLADITFSPNSSVQYFSIEVNFAHGGLGIDGTVNRSIFQRRCDPTLALTDVIEVRPPSPVKVPCQSSLVGDGVNEIEIIWMDKDRVPITTMTNPTDEWSMTLVVEWRQEITRDRYAPSGTESRFR